MPIPSLISSRLRAEALRLIAALVVLTASSIRVCAQIPRPDLLWFRASDIASTPGMPLDAWSDRVDARRAAVQTNPLVQPTFERDARGRSAVHFSGTSFMRAPSVFPVFHDYSLVVVVRIPYLAGMMNIVSGDKHALWLENSPYPQVLHSDLTRQHVSTIPLQPDSVSVITVRYSELTQQAKLYVNGVAADSSYVLSNSDSTIYLGAFLGTYCLLGDLYEVQLYNREITEAERQAIEGNLEAGYSITPGTAPVKPTPIFTAVPAPLQVYPRDPEDSATVHIAGALGASSALDSASLTVWKNGTPLEYYAQALQRTDQGLSFSFAPRIHAELSEYRFVVRAFSEGRDSLLADVDSVVCGDALLIDGQSNAIFGYDSESYQNEFVRTLGKNMDANIRDTSWSVAHAYKWGDLNSIGAWGQRLATDIATREQIPVVCINGGMSGTNIQSHLRDSVLPYGLTSYYGRMLYRVRRSGFSDHVRSLVWYQGELNYAEGYFNYFRTLYTDWMQDYPNLRHIYVMQNRPNYCGWGNIDMRDVQRSLQDSFPGVETIASAGLPNSDGCHFWDPGYDSVGDRLFASIARDSYHLQDTARLRSSNAVKAYFSDASHRSITVLFSPFGDTLHATPDFTIDGHVARLVDHIYLDDGARVTSLRLSLDTLELTLDRESSATHVTYLPDQYYNWSDSVIYDGPWIENSRGIGALLFSHLTIGPPPPPALTLPNLRGPKLTADASGSLLSLALSGMEGVLTCTIADATGAMVWTGSVTLHGGAGSARIPALASGAYFVHASDTSGIWSAKFEVIR